MKNKISTYTVCGYLDSGKTTFINKHLSSELNYGVIQFECGDTDITKNSNIHVLNIPYRNLIERKKEISDEIFNFISNHIFDQIWIEVNGVMDFQILKTIFYDSSNEIYKLLDFKNTFYVTDERISSILSSGNNNTIIEQIMHSDIAICSKKYSKLIKSVNNNLVISSKSESLRTLKELCKTPFFLLIASILAMINIYLISINLLPSNLLPIKSILLILKGIILQSFPFLLLGVIISSAIQIFMPKTFLEKYFPRDPFLGILFASLIGIIFPVCDCASIPVFRGLVKKGVPIPAAISFMIATPIINPIVIVSTYSAFGNISFVLLRCGLGVIIAILVGLLFHLRKSTNIFNYKTYNIDCNSYCSPDDSKFIQFFKHSQGEFLNVAKYLILGAVISSIIQTYLSTINWSNSATTIIGSIVVMMIAGFLLSLCSSSDAIIAKSFGNNIPIVSLLGFLIFGAMIDIKNIILLSDSFNKKFIIKLLIITALVSFIVLSLLSIVS